MSAWGPCTSGRSSWETGRNRPITVRAGTPTYTLHLWKRICGWIWKNTKKGLRICSSAKHGGDDARLLVGMDWCLAMQWKYDMYENYSSQRINKWVNRMMSGKTHKLLKSAGATAEHHKEGVFRDVHVPDFKWAVWKHCYWLMLSNAFQLQHSRMGNCFKRHISF